MVLYRKIGHRYYHGKKEFLQHKLQGLFLYKRHLRPTKNTMTVLKELPKYKIDLVEI
jgi:hypothetical protein